MYRTIIVIVISSYMYIVQGVPENYFKNLKESMKNIFQLIPNIKISNAKKLQVI